MRRTLLIGTALALSTQACFDGDDTTQTPDTDAMTEGTTSADTMQMSSSASGVPTSSSSTSPTSTSDVDTTSEPMTSTGETGETSETDGTGETSETGGCAPGVFGASQFGAACFS